MKKNFFNNPRFKHGSLATVITIIVIAAIVLVNIVTTLLLERYPLTIDLTAEKRFSITQESVDFIKSTTKDVKLKVCVPEETLKNEGEWYRQAYEILKNYTKYGDKVTLEFIDLTRNPTFTKSYTQYSLAVGDVIVESDLRTKKFSIDDMFQYQDTQYGSVIHSSEAEQVITSAIMYVTDEKTVKAVSLTGIDNVDVSGYTEILKHNNYEILEQNLLSEDIDQEADLVILGAPSTDITIEQVEKLDKYLDNNGQFGKSLIFVSNFEKTVGPIMKNFLADWGLEVGEGVVAETNGQNAINNAFTIINKVDDSDISVGLKNKSLPVISRFSNPINILFESSGNRKVTSLISTSDTACIFPLDAKEDFDFAAQETKSHSIAAKSIRTKYIDKETKVSSVIAIGSSEMLTTNFLNSATFSNGDIAVLLANQLTDKGDSITMLPVQSADKAITITNEQVKVYRNVFMIIIPLILIGIGIFVFARRRHL